MRPKPTTRPLPPVDVLRRMFRYDEETGRLLRIAHISGNVVQPRYVCGEHDQAHCRLPIAKSKYVLARIMWAVIHGYDPGNLQVDHIDGDRNNNRRDNLRLVNNEANNQNKRDSLADTAEFHNRSKTRPWRAARTKNNTKIHLGMFATEQEARDAIRQAKVDDPMWFMANRHRIPADWPKPTKSGDDQ